MDDDVKQLKENTIKWAEFAMKNLFAESQYPSLKDDLPELGINPEPLQQQLYFYAVLEVRFVFPNITEANRKVMTAYRFSNHMLNLAMLHNTISSLPQSAREDWEKVTQALEQDSCQIRKDYENHIKGELLDLQRRYVEQEFLSIDIPGWPPE